MTLPNVSRESIFTTLCEIFNDLSFFNEIKIRLVWNFNEK